jgi:hypothetical protein
MGSLLLKAGTHRPTVTAFVTVGFSFDGEPEYMHRHRVWKGLVKRPEDWRWSSYDNPALDKATIAACRIQIDHVRLPRGYRAIEKTTVRTVLTTPTPPTPTGQLS